jgi:hypothetical protein
LSVLRIFHKLNMSSSISVTRKHSNSLVEDDNDFDLPQPKSKRMKSENEVSETSSEGDSSEDSIKVARMAAAMKTIIEVIFPLCEMF